LKAVTWIKDSHGLFDYEYSQYTMKRFQINHSVKLFRMHEDVGSVLQDENIAVDESNKDYTEFLLSINKKAGGKFYCNYIDKYIIDVNSNANNPLKKHNIYLIVRSLKCPAGKSQRGYALSTGEVIKLGRIEYKVAEIQAENKTVQGTKITLSDNEFDVDKQQIPPGTEMMCRYCLFDQKDNDVASVDQALIFCCDCSGSSGGVHFSCLKSWIRNKIVTKSNNNTATYHWKRLECEVCKKTLPRKIIFKGQMHELINIERPDCPYIILDKIPAPNEPKASTLSLIIPNEHDSIKLGRGHQCDLRISDISVSRTHAYLKYVNGQFFILDNESKFGTLILLNNDYRITGDKAAIQIGRTVFTFIMKTGQAGAFNPNLMEPGIN